MPTSGMSDSLAEYPHWFVMACSLLVAIAVLWVILKLLKVALWMLVFVVVATGVLSVVWYLFR
jgi:uncharacterized membrane protein YhdT